MVLKGEYALLNSTMNQEFINRLNVNNNGTGENFPLTGTGLFRSKQKKIKSGFMDRNQLKKQHKQRKKVVHDDDGYSTIPSGNQSHSGSGSGNSSSSSSSSSSKYGFYNADDPIADFILLLKRAGADKIITYFLLDLLLKRGINKRTE